MSETVKTGWLKDNKGNKFAPKTLSSQVITSDGVTLESEIQSKLDIKMDKENPTGTGSFSMNRKADTIIGEKSIAIGDNTIASGKYSYAEGYYTTASSDCQHVQGKYNIEDTENKYIHIVGNGENDASYSNAHTLDWDGNAWFAGDVYVGGTSQDDENAIALSKENHTHTYNELEDKPFGDDIEIDIIPKADYEFDSAAGFMVNCPHFTLVEGEAYYVEWDSVIYECVATKNSSDYGDGEVIEISDSGFRISYFDNGNCTIHSSSGTHNIRVYTMGTKQLDNKYIQTALDSKMDKENPTGTGSFSLKGTADTDPQIQFLLDGSTEYDSRIYAIAGIDDNGEAYDDMHFEGADGYYFDANVRSVGNFYSGGKYKVNDGTDGCVLTDGHILLQTTNPSVRFMLEGNTDSLSPDARISLSENDNIYFDGAQSYNFDNRITTSANVYVGDKGSSTDGKTGSLLSNTGNLHIQNANEPTVYFYSGEGTDCAKGNIHLAYNGVMYFEKAQRYRFDANLASAANIYSYGKTAINDGTPGCFLGAGHMIAQATNPSLRFMLNGNTDSDNPDVKIWLSENDNMYFSGAQIYQFDKKLSSTYAIYAGEKLTSNDAKNGCALTDIGEAHLQGDAPSIKFYEAGSASYNGIIKVYRSSADSAIGMSFERANSYNFDNHIRTTGNIYTNGKSMVGDGVNGCAMTGGHVYLQGSVPSVRFYKEGSTEMNAMIQYSTSSSYMSFTKADGYSFDNRITTSANVYVGNKSSSSDGKTGSLLSNTGNLHLQGATPSVYFYKEGSTSYDGRMYLDTQDYFNFTGAQGYEFDANIRTSGNFYIAKSSVNADDGNNGFAFSKTGYMNIQGSEPSIRFFKSGSTAIDAMIYLSSSDILHFNGQSNTFIDNGSLYVSGAIGTNKKSSIGDGNYGVYMNASGNMYLHGKDTPIVGFVVGTATSYSSRIYANSSDYMMFTGASRYQFDAQLYSTTSTVATSDRNKKKDFKEFDERYENLFFDLKPQVYKFIDGTSDRFHSGFISQDVEESMLANGLDSKDFAGYVKDAQRRIVSESEDGIIEEEVFDEDGNLQYDYMLRYEEFIALNTHMLQKAYKQMEEMKKEIDTLKQLIKE